MSLPSRKNDLKRYIAERNAVLLNGTPDDLLDLIKRYRLHVPSCREVLELTFHKTVTGVASLPLDLRKKSKAWLSERGSGSLDDGELG